ncbi:hypothetical protein A1Q2_08411 [Trichosporon asahii var. asahii CBS 8904]|uniref:Uncharacterized protein n=1 Tax=Trichosporon asahii var. asahii (strain CBS 8904) TaxID=1220162 RepID=K1W655_TRIAC|nr:hypothetical protein A1Q2_08411 [Trichosporon asahii var. asahii CBS 8904]
MFALRTAAARTSTRALPRAQVARVSVARNSVARAAFALAARSYVVPLGSDSSWLQETQYPRLQPTSWAGTDVALLSHRHSPPPPPRSSSASVLSGGDLQGLCRS